MVMKVMLMQTLMVMQMPTSKMMKKTMVITNKMIKRIVAQIINFKEILSTNITIKKLKSQLFQQYCFFMADLLIAYGAFCAVCFFSICGSIRARICIHFVRPLTIWSHVDLSCTICLLI